MASAPKRVCIAPSAVKRYALTHFRPLLVAVQHWPCCDQWVWLPVWVFLLGFYRNHSPKHTHTHLTDLYPRLPGWASTRKVKPIWILLKQETVSGSGISWAICKSAPRSRQITMPTPHHSVFTGQMSFEHLTTEKNKTNDSVTQVNIEWLVIPVIQSISLVTF